MTPDHWARKQEVPLWSARTAEVLRELQDAKQRELDEREAAIARLAEQGGIPGPIQSDETIRRTEAEQNRDDL